jgi:hypothetical protein
MVFLGIKEHVFFVCSRILLFYEPLGSSLGLLGSKVDHWPLGWLVLIEDWTQWKKSFVSILTDEFLCLFKDSFVIVLIRFNESVFESLRELIQAM